MSSPDFLLKGSTVTVVVLELHQYVPDAFPGLLAERVAQAPALFQGSPVVISLEPLSADDGTAVDLGGMLDHCRDQGLRPIAFRAVPEALQSAATDTGLALLPAGGGRGKPLEMPAESAPEAPEIKVRTEQQPVSSVRPTRTITRPVRSGQQIYAEGGDLIVLAPVSEGAEVLADGNIHIYGALRGRALAGVHGDASARIFCQHMDAELISVAGHFLLSDALGDSILRKPAQVSLDGDVLSVSAL
ncbi:septum site-determining protein MinC [Parahaliea maris]|uniref:Probable septum site-determining protein MinC n=1 Tax=Parahaliea maris TaxID=2716870 RepID=A0A5C8ZNH2_9GAMM|nr:septum site-determining protein MinC [Parahaliea maris]TXS88931.1 septum site-determining protein MinC [Parahaliea maris]